MRSDQYGFFHDSAAGDFLLMSREVVHAIRGYPEMPIKALLRLFQGCSFKALLRLFQGSFKTLECVGSGCDTGVSRDAY